MSDEALHRRIINKRMIGVAVFLCLLSAAMWYYYFSTQSAVNSYTSQISQQNSLQSQVESLESSNSQLRATIEQTGKELVSFTDDKIKYVNLASTLSEGHDVSIGKLMVSDVWNEGQMAGMTVSIEVEGTLNAITNFINDYCNIKYTNRINVVSCRPIGRFPWMSRGIDGELVLDWFDLTSEFALYEEQLRAHLAEIQQAASEAGLPAAIPGIDSNSTPQDIQNAIDNITSGTEEPNNGAINSETGRPEGGTGSDTETPVQDPTVPPPSNFGDGNNGNTIVSSGVNGETVTFTRTAMSFSAPPGGEDSDSLGLVEGEDYVTPNTVKPEVNPDTYVNPYSGAPTVDPKTDTPITVSDIFAPKMFKIYLEIDFLGRE